MIDPRPRGVAEIIRDRQNFVRRFAVIHFVLRKGTRGADCEKFGGNANEPRKQKLLTIELWTEARHGVKQTTCQLLARSRRVIHMFLQIAMKIVDLARAG